MILPAEDGARTESARNMQNFAKDLQVTHTRVIKILDMNDEIVADGLGLTPAEHDTIRQRCQELPLSVTVERPRFAWSADRKTQARRTYRPGERFKS